MKLLKRDVGNEVFLIAWSRQNRNAEPVVDTGTLTKLGSVNVTIGNTTLKIKREDDFCVVASIGDVSDSYTRIYRHREDVEKQLNADKSRRTLVSVFADSQSLKNIPIQKIEQILTILNQD